jgi:dihydroorotase
MQRRRFIGGSLLVLPFLHGSMQVLAAEADLLIRGGRVVDPAAGIDGTFDVAVGNGQVLAIGRDLDYTAAKLVDATGLLVLPGLIDVHVHARDAELPPADNLRDGVTTLVDAGSRGAENFDSILQIAQAAPNRMRMLLNIAGRGNFNGVTGGRGEFLDGIAAADIGAAREAIAEHGDWIVGVKARLSRGASGDLDHEILARAVQAAEPSGLPVMVHIGDTVTPLPRLLELLRSGDIITHVYAPTPNGILDQDGRLLPEVRAARERGIRFDFGNGLNEHWSWQVAELALQQDFPPDTISSDLNLPGRKAQVFNLPNVMSKFLQMGRPLQEVVACVTSNAAATFGSLAGLGTLQPGAAADIALVELAQGDFEFEDNYGGTRRGASKLLTRGVIMGGRLLEG